MLAGAVLLHAVKNDNALVEACFKEKYALDIF